MAEPGRQGEDEARQTENTNALAPSRVENLADGGEAAP